MPVPTMVREGDRMPTNSSAAVGWMPAVLSNCSFVAPALSAIAMPCTASVR